MALYLSDLQGAWVLDRSGRRVGRLEDLVVRQVGQTADTTGLVVRHGRRLGYWPLAVVATVAPGVIRLQAAGPGGGPPPDGEVWLVRDLLDAQIVDMTGARVVRVNDVVLDDQPERLVVAGVDVGLWGLLRRLGWAAPARWLASFLGWRAMETFIPWADLAPIPKGPLPGPLAISLDRLKQFHPYDLAEVVEAMGWQQRQSLCHTLSDPQLAKLLHESRPAMQAAMLDEMGPARVARVLAAMAADDIADLVADLPPARAQALLATLPPDRAGMVGHLLSYAADTAGGLMTTEMLVMPQTATVTAAVRRLRAQPLAAETANEIHLVDREGRLTGVVSMRHLLLAPGHARLASIASPVPATVYGHTPLARIVDLIGRYRPQTVPVVDGGRRLLGVVSSTDALTLACLPKTDDRG